MDALLTSRRDDLPNQSNRALLRARRESRRAFAACCVLGLVSSTSDMQDATPGKFHKQRVWVCALFLRSRTSKSHGLGVLSYIVHVSGGQTAYQVLRAGKPHPLLSPSPHGHELIGVIHLCTSIVDGNNTYARVNPVPPEFVTTKMQDMSSGKDVFDFAQQRTPLGIEDRWAS
jgi:hypothetical protein